MGDNDSNGNNDDGNGREYWPGPFSTANDLIRRREAAKRTHLNKIAARASLNNETGITEEMVDGEKSTLDDYEIYARTVMHEHRVRPVTSTGCCHDDLNNYSAVSGEDVSISRRTQLKKDHIPSLFELAMKSVVDNIDLFVGSAENTGECDRNLDALVVTVESDASFDLLDMLSSDCRSQLSFELAKNSRLTSDKVLALLCSPHSQVLTIPDCSKISETDLITAIDRVALGTSAAKQQFSFDALAAEASSESAANRDTRAETKADHSGITNPSKSRKRKTSPQDTDDVNVNRGKTIGPKADRVHETGCMVEATTCSMESESLFKDCASQSRCTSLPVSMLQLKSCGFAFTREVASRLARLQDAGAVQLEILELTGLYRLHDGYLCVLLAGAPRLHSLNIACNSSLSGKGICQGIVKNLRFLKELILDDCVQLSDNDLLSLTSTAISASEARSSEVGQPLEQLECLSLCGLLLLSDDTVVRLLDCYGSRLKTFRINGCVQLTDTAVYSLCSPAEKTCAGNSGDSNISTGSNVGRLPLLRQLGIAQLPLVTTKAMLALFSAFGDANCLSDDVFDRMNPYRPLRGLEVVEMQNNGASITDEVIVQLSLTSGEHLRSLNLANSRSLSNRGVAALCKLSFARLNDIDLSFCRRVDESLLLALINASCSYSNSDSVSYRKSQVNFSSSNNRQSGLARITLWGCSHLSKQFFIDCAQRFPSLKLEG